MEQSLCLIEEARQALQNPEGQSNAQNLAQVAKDVSQVRWMDRWMYGWMTTVTSCLVMYYFFSLNIRLSTSVWAVSQDKRM
jgi:hypothetical protein